jgi:hypothetical protein
MLVGISLAISEQQGKWGTENPIAENTVSVNMCSPTPLHKVLLQSILHFRVSVLKKEYHFRLLTKYSLLCPWLILYCTTGLKCCVPLKNIIQGITHRMTITKGTHKFLLLKLNFEKLSFFFTFHKQIYIKRKEIVKNKTRIYVYKI